MRWFINWITLKGKVCAIAEPGFICNTQHRRNNRTKHVYVANEGAQLMAQSWIIRENFSLPCPSKQLWTTAVNLMAWHLSVYTVVSVLPICVLMLHVLKCPEEDEKSFFQNKMCFLPVRRSPCSFTSSFVMKSMHSGETLSKASSLKSYLPTVTLPIVSTSHSPANGDKPDTLWTFFTNAEEKFVWLNIYALKFVKKVLDSTTAQRKFSLCPIHR